MQKKLIALAIASAMTVPALAYAEVNISGQANMSIDMKNTGTATASETINQLNSNQSRLVIKGSEDLGSGLTAMYQLDSRFTLDDGSTGTGTLFSGNTYLGLKSNDLGTVMFGNLDTPYKSSTRGLDIFFDVAGDNRTALGGLLSAHDTRLKNSIIYNSPNMSGFSVSAGTVFGGETAVIPGNPNKKGQAISMAGTYKMDNIYATLAYQTVKAGDPNTGDLGAGSLGLVGAAIDDEAKAFKLGGGYSMDQFTVNAVYEKPSSKVALTAAETTSTNLYLAGKFALNSSDNIGLAYTKRGETETAGVKGADDASQVAIGYDHSMSKATSVYAHYVKTTANGNLPDPSNLSFGLKHAF